MMACQWIHLFWLRILVLIFVVKGISGAIYCYQCSWESGSVSAGELVHCEEGELEEGKKLGRYKFNPIEQPKCTGQIIPGYKNEQSYNVLKEMCYPKACQASQGGGVCAKWTFILEGKVVNTTLFCGVSQETGCFDQPMEGGYTKEVCLCNSGHYCNEAAVTRSAKNYVVLVALVMTAVLKYV